MPDYKYNPITNEIISITNDEPKTVYEKLIPIAELCNNAFLLIAKKYNNPEQQTQNEYTIYTELYFKKHYPTFNVTENTLNLIIGEK